MGAVLESLILLPAIPEVPSFIQAILQNTGITPPPSQWVYLMLYYAIPIIYSIPASLAFTPKRVVSPLNILMGASSLYSIYLASSLVQSYPYFLVFEYGAIIWLLFFAVALIVGIPEAWLVRLLVGLNGDMDSLSMGSNPARKTYIVPVPFQKVVEIIFNPTNLDVWDMPKPRRKKNEVILQSYSSYEHQKLFIVRPHDSDNTIIASVAFEKRFYSIYQSEVASRRRDRLVQDIYDQLHLPMEGVVGTEDSVSLKAVEKVLSPTHSVFAPISEASKFLLGIVILTAVLLAISSAEFFIHPNNGFWASSILLIVIAFVVELAPSVKEYLESRAAESEEE